MPTIAVFAIATCVAALMLIVAVRGLTWHKISVWLNSALLLLVLFVAWQLVARSGSIPIESGISLALCGMAGLVAGVIHGQNTRMRFEPGEGDVICRRGALLSFSWAVVTILSMSLRAIPSLRAPLWATALPSALIFLTSTFVLGTIILMVRANLLRREHLAQLSQPENEQTAS